jgi:hypothetical protein
MNDAIQARGDVHILLTDKDGNVKLDRTEKNMVMNVGLAFMTSRLLNGTSTVMSHMAIGSNNTANAATMTTLTTETARSVLSSATQVTTTVTDDSVQFVATFIAGQGTGVVQEAALFNAASAGTMLSRLVFGVITKGVDDGLTLTWKIKLANAA